MAFDLPAPVMEALNRLEKAGYAAYAVGGCVRDWVLGMQPHDYDICTAATPKEMQEIFRSERTIETGLKHGTLTVLLDGMPLEITTFRRDGEYLDGRHPVAVSFAAGVEEDLSRRDFTINAMAYSPLRGLCDPFQGREDCKKGIIRCVGEAKRRFEEDALRILRALRFSARLGFPIEADTAHAIFLLKNNLQKISRERIAAEFSGILLGKDGKTILAEYEDVIFSILPELQFLSGDAWRETVSLLSFCPGDYPLRLGAILRKCHPSGEDEACALQAEKVLRGLKMPLKVITAAQQVILHRHLAITMENLQEMIWRLQPEGLFRLLQFQKANGLLEGNHTIVSQLIALEEKARSLLEEGCCHALSHLAVKGNDLVALGFRGPEIGTILEKLMVQVVRGQLENEREALLHAAQLAGME